MIGTLKKSGVALAMALAFGSAHAVLERAGPANNADNVAGFPAWYMDKTGVTLEFCAPLNATESAGGWCLAGPANTPESFAAGPGFFEPEHFYYAGSAVWDNVPVNPSISALLWESAIESTFLAEATLTDPLVFARIRFKLLPVPVTGQYKVYHPYLADPNVPDVFDGVAGDRIFETEDIGSTCGTDFSCATQGRVGPFLLPSASPGGAEDPAITGPVAGKLYIADPGRVGPVTGGGGAATGRLFKVRVEGPVGSNLDGLGNDFIETTDFGLMGRVFQGTIPGRVDVTRAAYEEFNGERKLDVLATGNQTRQARLPAGPDVGIVQPQLSFFETTLDVTTGDPICPPAGNPLQINMDRSDTSYFGQLQVTGANPEAVCVKDNAATPSPAFFGKAVTDFIDVTQSVYDPATKALQVTARSTAAFNGSPVLNLIVPGSPVPTVIPGNGQLVVVPLDAPPNEIRITSPLGGTATAPVKIGFLFNGGGGTEPPVVANDSFTVDEDSTVAAVANQFDVLANDTAGRPVDPTTLQIISNPVHGTASVVNGQIHYAPAANYFGADQLTYLVLGDNAVPSNVGTVDIAVTGSPDNPIATDDSAFVSLSNPTVTVSLLANDTDPDGQGDLRGAVITVLPATGVLTDVNDQPISEGQEIAGGVVKYTPAPHNVLGNVTFKYRAVDQGGLTSNEATATVDVLANEVLDTTLRQYRPTQSTGGAIVTRWIIAGTSNLIAGQTITATLLFDGPGTANPCTANCEIGTAVVDGAGAFRIDARGTGPSVTTNNGTFRVTSPLGGNRTFIYNIK